MQKKYRPSIVFLTGNAGTGKTTLLKYITGNQDRELDDNNLEFQEAVNSIDMEGGRVVVSPTGVAAINAKGSTINSFFQINPNKMYFPGDITRDMAFDEFRYKLQKKLLIKQMNVLIIDEISMVRADVIDTIDSILRIFRGRPDEPFGGVQVVMIGDLFQLPPIKPKEQYSQFFIKQYRTEYFFSSNIFKECYKKNDFKYIELKKIYRQKEQNFIDILNNIRVGKTTDQNIQDLNKRAIKCELQSGYVTLTTHNSLADEINSTKFNEIQSEEKTYKAIIDGDFKDDFFKSMEIVTLKVGCQVMVLKNNWNRGYYNGMVGVITELNENSAIIETEGISRKIEFEVWEKVEHELNNFTKKIDINVVGTFKQIPLKLAWAITVHKSQGLTFNNVVADIENSFDSGQVYVALSRCTSLEGLYLKSQINKSSIKINQDVVSFTNYVNSKS